MACWHTRWSPANQHKVTLGLVLGFGGLTLAFQDRRFVKLKPTVLYAFMALALSFGLWVLKNFNR
jgi:intracellular septation protein